MIGEATPPGSLASEFPSNESIHDVQQTTCCIVGGGPAGVMMALLLARQGVPVTLLEAHKDFDRDFRGDTIHPSTLEILDQLGIADRLHQLPHGKMRRMSIVTREGTTVLADLSRLKTKFPYVMMLPQAKFLDFIAEEAKRYPSFQLIMGANVQRLVQEGGVIKGVRYRGADDAWHEVRALLTVGADGRFSRVRHLTGMEPLKTSLPVDVAWFRLPRKPTDAQDEGAVHIHGGHFAILLDRAQEWQIGYVFLKGGYSQVRAAGIEALRRHLAELVPWLADRVDQLKDWKQVAVLSIESNRLKQWYLPGLLLIGDAAHTMSPVGGVGINYAIQDAVEAANMLGETLKKGQLEVADLAAVQKKRDLATWAIQTFQTAMMNNIVSGAIKEGNSFRLPFLMRLMLRLPLLCRVPAQMIAFGIRRVHVKRVEGGG